MPHWCNTLYKATGAKENVDRLANTMVELGNMSRPGLVENGFGSSWLGNLVAKVGGVLDSSFCRGEWFIDSPDVLSGFHVSLEKAKREIWRKRDLLFGREILMSTDNLKRRIYEDLRMVNRYSSRPLKKEIDQLWERDIRKREYKRIVSLIEEDKL